MWVGGKQVLRHLVVWVGGGYAVAHARCIHALTSRIMVTVPSAYSCTATTRSPAWRTRAGRSWFHEQPLLMAATASAVTSYGQ